MGRPRTYGERVSTAIRLPLELHHALHKIASTRQVAVNYLITEAVREWLDRQPVSPPPSPVKSSWWRDILRGEQGPS